MSPCIDYLRVALMLSDSHHLLPLSCPVASDGLVCNGMVQIHSEQTSLKFCSLSYWQMCVSLIQPSLDPIIIKRKKNHILRRGTYFTPDITDESLLIFECLTCKPSAGSTT